MQSNAAVSRDHGTDNFSKAIDSGGAITASNIGGVPGSGSGTYVIARTKDGAEELKMNGSGAIHSPLGTFTAEITENIRLTPIKICGRVGYK